MSRLLRGGSQFHGRLSRPVSVSFAPPTQQQQTINVNCLTHTVRDSALQRRAPMGGGKVFPPAVVEPSLRPPDRRLRVAVVLARQVRRPVHSDLRPPIAAAVDTTAPPILVRLVRRPTQRVRYGLAAPKAILPLPTQAAQTVRVTLVAVSGRLVQRRPITGLRDPLVGPAVTFSGPPIVQVATRARRARPLPHSRLGPPQFYPATSVVRVTLAKQVRRPVHSRLAAPQVLQTFTAAPVAALAARSRVARASLTRSVLRPPIAAAAVTTPPPILVHVARALRPQTHSHLGKPLVLIVPAIEQAEETIRVVAAWRTRTEVVRRAPHSRLRGPQFYPATSTISVTLAARTRAALAPRVVRARLAPPTATQVFSGPRVALTRFVRRPVHSRLAAPQFYPATSEIQATLAGRTRVEAQRRRPRWFLLPPTVLRVPQVEQQENTIKVVLAPKARRRTLSRLSPPTALQVFDGPQVVLARSPRRRTSSHLGAPTALQIFGGPTVIRTRTVRPRAHSKLGEPTVLVIPSVEQAEETVRVVLAGRTRAEADRRAPHSKLSGPFFYASTSTIRTVLAERTRLEATRRASRSRLAPPQFYPATSTISVTLAGRTRASLVCRPARSELAPPSVFSPADPTLRQQTILVLLAGRTRVELGRRAAHFRLAPPVILPATSVIRVTLARVPSRRLLHSKLAGPVVAATESARRITVQVAVTDRLRRKPTHALLTPPAALQTFSGPETVVSVRRTLDVRRVTHGLLRPPTVTGAAFVANPVSISLAPARRPLVRSKLAPPVFYAATSTIRTVLTRIIVPPTRSQVRPPQVVAVQFVAPPVNVTLAAARRPHPVYRLTPPTVVAPRAAIQPPVYVKRVAVTHRSSFQRRGPHSHLRPFGPTHRNGVACLIDLPAALACLANIPATLACLLNDGAANACLTNDAATTACLYDRQAFTATLVDKE